MESVGEDNTQQKTKKLASKCKGDLGCWSGTNGKEESDGNGGARKTTK